jgi:hypothetical protein
VPISKYLKMINSAKNSDICKVSDLVESINSHPFRCEEMPLEAALSFPVPLMNGDHHKIGFFYYSIGGSITNRLIGPPTYRVIASLRDLDQIQFIPVTPQDMGLDVAPDAALEKIEMEPRKEGAESYDNLTSQLYAAVDQLIQIYPKAPELLSEVEKQAAQIYQTTLNKVAKHSLIPAYKALNPHFFNWLDLVNVN